MVGDCFQDIDDCNYYKKENTDRILVQLFSDGVVIVGSAGVQCANTSSENKNSSEIIYTVYEEIIGSTK